MKKRKNYKRRKKNRKVQLYMRLFVTVMVAFVVFLGVYSNLEENHYTENKSGEIDGFKQRIDVQLLSVNPYSRPEAKTERIKGIVIHYTANPGSTAMQNRNYFEGLKDSHKTKASSHFIVGLDGEIVQCVPTWEVAYASNTRNKDTVSIETCHRTEAGSYTKKTYQSLVELTAWLCKKFDLNENDVIRHYDVTGKNCPKYFVENEKAWETFKEDVKKELE